MKAVNLFLGKFADLKPLNFDLKLALIKSVKTRTGITLAPTAIQVRDRGVYLALSPAYRQLLFIHRENIVADLSQALQQPTRSLI